MLDLSGFVGEPLDSPGAATSARTASRALQDVERDHVELVLKSAAWRIEGSGGAAQILGLRPSTLRTRMRKLGLRRPS